MTVVAYCQKSSRFPRPAPRIIEGEREIGPIGGELQQQQDGWINFYYYPATAAERMEVVQGSRSLAILTFDDAPQRSGCGIRATSPVSLVDCGAVLVADWRTPLKQPPASVELMDVDVVDAKTGQMLGFMQQGFSEEEGRLVVTFGFRRPTGREVVLGLRYLYINDPNADHPRERTFDPPIEKRFFLRRVG